MSFTGPALAVIRFEMSEPTADSLAAAIDAATGAAPDNNLYIRGMTKRFGSQECDTLQREAREAAIADAREQAVVGDQQRLPGFHGADVALLDVALVVLRPDVPQGVPGADIRPARVEPHRHRAGPFIPGAQRPGT